MENLEIKQIILLNVKSHNILFFVLTFMENLLLKTLACFFRKLSKKKEEQKGQQLLKIWKHKHSLRNSQFWKNLQKTNTDKIIQSFLQTEISLVNPSISVSIFWNFASKIGAFTYSWKKKLWFPTLTPKVALDIALELSQELPNGLKQESGNIRKIPKLSGARA